MVFHAPPVVDFTILHVIFTTFLNCFGKISIVHMLPFFFVVNVARLLNHDKEENGSISISWDRTLTNEAERG